MRTLRLARIAAEAEGLRLRRQAQRTVVRIVVGLIGLMFLAWALVFAHIAAWFWLRDSLGWSEPGAAAAVTGADLIIAAILALLAARSSPSRIEREALQVRQRALDSATSRFALTTSLVPAIRLVLDLLRRPKQQ
jgi:phage shock protein PspC (stress-responsive transcriptional regulator)